MYGFMVKVYKDGKCFTCWAVGKNSIDVQLAAMEKYFPCQVYVKLVIERIAK